MVVAPAKQRTHRIVFANEKGGTGKSTTAVHVAVAMSYLGARVTMLDLDPRQRTSHRYMENRYHIMQRRGLHLPTPACEVFKGRSDSALLVKIDKLEKDCDFLIIDNPGRDDPLARAAVEQADTLVTPMNDSFVDFDLLARINPETEEILGPSLYSEMVWSARKTRAISGVPGGIDWVVMRNRVSATRANNKKKMGDKLEDLSGRIGFRLARGFGDRVIYRELFPAGLTLLDLGGPNAPVRLSTMSHVTARIEIRSLIAMLNLPTAGNAPEADPALETSAGKTAPQPARVAAA